MTSPSSSGAAQGRVAVRHDDHIDFLDHGHLIHEEQGRRVEHVIAVSAKNPADCDPHRRAAAIANHKHGPDCGHEAVPHGDHIDYLVDGRLQYPHGDHVDDHGPLTLA